MSQRRSRILLGAYACEPNKGSEEGIGWNVANGLAEAADVWVLTREEGRTSIEATTLPDSLHIIFHDLKPYQERFKQSEQLHYLAWQLSAAKVARKLQEEIHFDSTQHVTWNRYWMPSAVVLPGVPFLWGPVGGGEVAPKALRDTGWKNEFVRDTARVIGQQFVRRMAKQSSIALATTAESATKMSAVGATDVRVQPAVGLSKEDVDILNHLPTPSGTPNFISAGRLVNWKGFHFGLQAFALARKMSPKLADSIYWIIGSGPEKERLIQDARNLNLGDSVQFIEHIPRTEFLDRIAQSHALIHPSLHDSGGFVCLEAMAAGRPVLALDLGGPGTLVSRDAGIVIRASTPETIIRHLADAIVKVATDINWVHESGQAGRQHIETHYLWSHIVDVYHRLHTEIIEGRK